MNKKIFFLIVTIIMVTYFAQITNNKTTFLDACGQPIQELAQSSARLAFHPKGGKISVVLSQDSRYDNLEKSLLYLYKAGFKSTYFINTNNIDAQNIYNTSLCDLGIYMSLSNTSLLSQLRSIPPVFTELDNIISQVKISNGNNKPLTASYGGGQDDYKANLYEKFFGARNSTHDNNSKPEGTDGGPNANNAVTCIKNIGKVDWISKSNTYRWLYYGAMDTSSPDVDFYSGTEAEGVIDANNKIENAFNQDGVFISFGHWHWADTDYFLRHLNTLNTAINNRDVFKGTFQELAVYQFIKEVVDNVSLSGSLLTIDYSIKDATRPYDDISTDLLWLELNLAGTSFENQFISINNNARIIQKSSNLYAVGVSLDFVQTQKVLTISTAVDNSQYDNLNIPIVSVSGNTITSDQAIKYTLFSYSNSQQEYDVIIEEYNHNFLANHTITTTLDIVNRKYIIGFINEFGVTETLNIN